MKKLSIEEKAKRYDEAIEIARKINSGDGVPVPPDWTTCEVIFPELKENEDEKIREGLIQYFKDFTLNTFAGLDPKKILAWLEKQGQTEYDKDMLGAIEYCKKNNRPLEKEHIAWLEKQGKEEYALKSFKDEDVRKFMQCIEKQAKAYEFNLPNRGYDIYAFAKDLLVWLEKQGEQKPTDVRTTGYWNVQEVEQKPAWSEEDVINYNYALAACIYYGEAKGYTDTETHQKTIDWLKSLRPQSQWKPSEGQLECLGYVIEKAEKDWSPLTNNRIYLTLKELKEQLNKLRSVTSC